jgi:multisubunit Na+/H+ antiporter MnhB subunit
MIEVTVLLIFILIAAAIAVEIQSLFSAEVALGVLGIALCVIFFVLRAPEVAITQLIVELLVLVVLLNASGLKHDMSEVKGGLRERLAFASIIGFVLIFGAVSVWALRNIPVFGTSPMTVAQTYINFGLEKGVIPNLISLVMFDFRTIDTLAVIAILFASVVGALSLLGQKGKEK